MDLNPKLMSIVIYSHYCLTFHTRMPGLSSSRRVSISLVHFTRVSFFSHTSAYLPLQTSVWITYLAHTRFLFLWLLLCMKVYKNLCRSLLFYKLIYLHINLVVSSKFITFKTSKFIPVLAPRSSLRSAL